MYQEWLNTEQKCHLFLTVTQGARFSCPHSIGSNTCLGEDMFAGITQLGSYRPRIPNQVGLCLELLTFMNHSKTLVLCTNVDRWRDHYTMGWSTVAGTCKVTHFVSYLHLHIVSMKCFLNNPIFTMVGIWNKTPSSLRECSGFNCALKRSYFFFLTNLQGLAESTWNLHAKRNSHQTTNIVLLSIIMVLAPISTWLTYRDGNPLHTPIYTKK